MIPRGEVQRLTFPENELPFVEFRTRNEDALLAVAEWDWSRDRAAAYVFEDFSDAERHAEQLTAEGMRFVNPVVVPCVTRPDLAPSAPIVPEPEFEHGATPPRRILRPVRRARCLSGADAMARWERDREA